MKKKLLRQPVEFPGGFKATDSLITGPVGVNKAVRDSIRDAVLPHVLKKFAAPKVETHNTIPPAYYQKAPPVVQIGGECLNMGHGETPRPR
ncbi:MAG: hypothetical protein PHE24_00790 [Patescibacteria group bacterium]|nr:hypothetical protein [Patescibacteria group bacterium]